jgi:hypothetical protein
VAEREPQDSVRARHRDLDGGRDTPPIANDEARPPTEAIELLERPLDHDLAVEPVGRRFGPDPRQVERDDVGPLLEQRPDPPLELGERRDEQQPGTVHLGGRPGRGGAESPPTPSQNVTLPG